MSALKWSDIWLLQALRQCRDDAEDIDLAELLAVADGINHAVMTFEEFNSGLYRLREAGLVQIDNKRYLLTVMARNLFNEFADQSVFAQMEEVTRKLGAEAWSEQYNPNAVGTPEFFVSKGNFNNAIQIYQQRYGR